MRARKVDANQAAIISGLRKLGIGVLPVNGAVDLVCGHQGRNFLLDIKNPERMTKAGKSWDDGKSRVQEKLKTEWPGQYAVVKSLDEVLIVIGAVEVIFEAKLGKGTVRVTS